jgi:fumarylacetoacetate (FAA) hydrolase family protein
VAFVLGDILTALTQPQIVVGALVALVIVGLLFLANVHFDWFMSTKRHKELAEIMKASVDAAKSSSDRAHNDADAKVVSMRAAMERTVGELQATMERRIQEQRQDGAERAAQVRSDSQAELDRLLKIVEAVQREVESWRQAFHLADQANREEDDARWTQIQAALAVLERFVTEVQRQVLVRGHELEAGRDGGTADVR